MAFANLPILVAWGPGPAVAGWRSRRLPGCRGSIIRYSPSSKGFSEAGKKEWGQGWKGGVGMSQERILTRVDSLPAVGSQPAQEALQVKSS